MPLRYVPTAIAEGNAERGAVIFWRHEIYKKAVSSVEAGISIKG